MNEYTAYCDLVEALRMWAANYGAQEPRAVALLAANEIWTEVLNREVPQQPEVVVVKAEVHYAPANWWGGEDVGGW